MAQITISALDVVTTLTSTDKLAVDQSDKTRGVTLDALKTYIDSQLIGTIQIFAYNSVPAGYLLCDGSEVAKTDYPALYAKIGDTFGNTDLGYTAVTSSDNFRVPALEDYFIRNKGASTTFGTIQSDTMRKLTGYGGETQINSNGNSGDLTDKTATGIFFPTNNAKIIEGVWSSVDSTVINRYALKIDSSYGVEGQEGTVSENVGSETAPMHVSLVFGIKAK